ncbi:hypothetical protein FACS1894200_03010 [Spirochaetia bacterium]|nr:hypothetical protein FACS1894200_03010 [Spirochaetia bacterium]
MNNLNSVLIEGNLVKDPEFRVLPKGSSLCKFSIASNRRGGDQDEVSFFEVETWKDLAENCRQLGFKGRGVRVVGRLKQGRWTDADSGKIHSKVIIVAEHVEFRPIYKHEADVQEKVAASVSKSSSNTALESFEAYEDAIF